METSETRAKLADAIRQLESSGRQAEIPTLVSAYKAKYQSPTPIASTESLGNDNTYGATFRASPDDNPLEAGLKAAGNIPSSALNLAKGVFSAIANPIETAKGVYGVAKGGVQKLVPGEQEDEQKFNAFTGFLKERYGSLENLQKTATEDPFGFGTDIIGVLTGGAAIAGKAGQAANVIGKTGQLVTKPVAKVASATANKVGQTAKFGVSQATGLNPETITELIKNPKAFESVTSESRLELADSVKKALDSRLEDLSDLGSEYQIIRETPSTVVIPEGVIGKVFKKYGIKVDGDGKIVTGPESRPLSAGDRTGLEEFIKDYGSQRVLSNNGFLNTREKLSKLSKYDSTRTDISQAIARELRSEYDKVGKEQIRGLKELDSDFAPERELLGRLKKDIFDASGELKDGAISRIANVTGKGKEKLLTRMKEILPDIEQRVKVIKAVEDIERSSGIKTGTYVRSLVVGGGALTGNIPAIVGAILSQPEIAVPLLKGAGYTGKAVAPILNTLRTIVGDVNNFRVPTPLLNNEGQLKMGLSIEDVTKRNSASVEGMKNIPKDLEPLAQEARKYKSAEEFVKNTNLDIANPPKTLYKGVGGDVPNINQMVWGEHFADNPSVAKGYGSVVNKTDISGAKIADLDKVKEYFRLTRQLATDPKTISKYLSDKGYDFARGTLPGKGYEYIKLPKSGWEQAGDWFPGEPIAWKGKYAVFDDVKNGEATGKYVVAEENKGTISKKFNSVQEAQNYVESQLTDFYNKVVGKKTNASK